MSYLAIRLEADPYDVDTWNFHVRVSYRGFAGQGVCQVAGDQVRAAASAMERYPLPDDELAKLEGGLLLDLGDLITAHVSVRPDGPRGQLELRVIAKQERLGGKYEQGSELSVSAPFDYEQAAALSRGLLSLLQKEVNEVEIRLE